MVPNSSRSSDRLAGLDRKTILPALGVLVIAIIFFSVIPAINSAIGYDDPIKEGERLAISKEITFQPTPGWDLTTGIRAGDKTRSKQIPPVAAVAKNSVSMRVQTALFKGDAGALLDQVEKLNENVGSIKGFNIKGDPKDVTTDQGMSGKVAQYTGTSTSGAIATFVFKGKGVEMVASGLPRDVADFQDDIESMISSVKFKPSADGKQ